MVITYKSWVEIRDYFLKKTEGRGYDNPLPKKLSYSPSPPPKRGMSPVLWSSVKTMLATETITMILHRVTPSWNVSITLVCEL